MVARAFVFAGLVSLSSLAFSMATAEEAGAPHSIAAEGVAFESDYAEPTAAPAFTLTAREDFSARLSTVRPDPRGDWSFAAPRRYEVTFAAQAGNWDVALAPRAAILANRDGDIGSARAGVEARIGQRLARVVRPWQTPSWDQPTWYFFAASDGQALTWAPDVAVPGRTNGLRLQDRVELGDMQAGISMEAGGLQTSFAYVQRDISGVGGSAEENFAGVTLTWRR
ncbi:MAG: hypothetical protein NW203_07245 [Hyphomonadaceae bacterium]|nr:hypothetical protein [Hyphomonadaceae bacterium]